MQRLPGDRACLRLVLLRAQVTCVDILLAVVEEDSAVDRVGINSELLSTLRRRASAFERALGLFFGRTATALERCAGSAWREAVSASMTLAYVTSSLAPTDKALFFTSWQTKVERKRRSTRRVQW